MYKWDLEYKKSFMIGDKKTDITAGESAGINTIKIRKNQDLRKVLNKLI